MKSYDEWRLDTGHIGRRILVFDCLDSTNTYIASALRSEDSASRLTDGDVIIADAQTAGRGQPGRTWTCSPGDGVMMSILIFPPAEFCRAPVLTAWAAVSVCDTILEIAKVRPSIKWPNDVLVDGKKICGILTEQSPGHAVVGIGLNVNQSAEDFQRADLPDAISLAIVSGTRSDHRGVAKRLVYRLDESFGRLDYLEERWKTSLGFLNKSVGLECLDGVRRGFLRSASFDFLTLDTSDGATISIRPEIIRHIREM